MKEYTVEVTSVTTVTVKAENEDEATTLACGEAWKYDADSIDGVILGPDGKKPAAVLESYDRRLLDDLDTLAEKLEKQANPNKTGVAMLGVLSPALASLVPATTEAGKKDLAVVTKAKVRLCELLGVDYTSPVSRRRKSCSASPRPTVWHEGEARADQDGGAPAEDGEHRPAGLSSGPAAGRWAGRGLCAGRPEYQASVQRPTGLLDGGLHPHRHRPVHRPVQDCGEEPGGEYQRRRRRGEVCRRRCLRLPGGCRRSL